MVSKIQQISTEASTHAELFSYNISLKMEWFNQEFYEFEHKHKRREILQKQKSNMLVWGIEMGITLDVLTHDVGPL